MIICSLFTTSVVKATTTCSYSFNFKDDGCDKTLNSTIKFDNSGNPTFSNFGSTTEFASECSGFNLMTGRDNTNRAKTYFSSYKTCPPVAAIMEDGLNFSIQVLGDNVVYPDEARVINSTPKMTTDDGGSGGGSGGSQSQPASQAQSTVNETVCTKSNVPMRNESWTVNVSFKIVNGVNKVFIQKNGGISAEGKVTEPVGLSGYTFSLDQSLWVPIFSQKKCPDHLYFSLADNSNTTITITDKKPNESLDGSYSVTDSPTQEVPQRGAGEGYSYKDIGNVGDNFCSQKEVKQILIFFGIIILILKFLVPILIIIKGTFLFYNAVVKGGSDDITKNAKELGIKIFLGVLVFFIPSIIKGILNLYNDFSTVESEYTDCATCLLEPEDCDAS
jgi:hypothetical protein